MDPFAELALIVGISVVAHVSVAWTAIYVHTRRAERRWTEKVEREMIPNAAHAAADEVKKALPHVPTVDELAEAVPLPQIGTELEAWLRSEPGKLWARELGSFAGSQAVSSMKEQLGSEVGVVARQAQAAGEKLLMGAISFGDPWLDGIWALAPVDKKRTFVRRALKVLQSAMAGDVNLGSDLTESTEEGNGLRVTGVLRDIIGRS